MIRTVLGRAGDVDILVNDRKASRRHASIFYSGSEFRIRDEGSANGTLLNGSKVGEYIVRDGDEVTVGDTVLRFRLR
jgi:pSer/pThr/pTyr-binding forkhead associated (FHA) protein